jgi:cytochrome c2
MINISGGGSLAAGVSAVSSGAQGETLPDDPAARGEYWFSRPPAICGTCHALVPDTVVVGPSLAGIAERAATRVPDMSAEQYLRESILNPGEYVVEGFPDAMQKNFGSVLTGDQINDIIAFLMTQ